MKTSSRLAFFLCFFLIFNNTGLTQKSYGDLYHPEANAANDIESLVTQATKENKHIILQVGGNWCVCVTAFMIFIKADSTLLEIVDQNFLVYHLNYSKKIKMKNF